MRQPNKTRILDEIVCECGCGEIFNKYDERNRTRKYIKNHYVKVGGARSGRFEEGSKPWNTGIPSKSSVWNKGLIGYKSGEEHYKWKGGLPLCLDCSKKLSVYTAKRCKLCTLKLVDMRKIGILGVQKQQNSKNPTNIERIVQNYLDKHGIIYEFQKLINNRFLVDFFIQEKNMVIEVDGAYWHSLDRVVKKDKAENAYLMKCGFNLVRLKEKEVVTGKFNKILGA